MKKKPDTAAQWKNPLVVEDAAAVSQCLLQGDKLRQKTAAGWALGTFVVELPCAPTLTAMSLAGFDFVVLDMEHSCVDFARLEGLIVAGQAAGLAVLVRTWGEDIGLIGKALDMGAHGILAPHVDTPERARAIVEQTRFAPLGRRSFAPLTKYDSLSEPLRVLNDSTFVVVQIEGKEGLERAGEIAAVPGLDAVFVGPYDLALSLGVPPGSAQVYEVAGHITDKVPRGVALGIYIEDPTTCGDWAARRFSLQCVSFDGRMLSSAARLIVRQARRGIGRKD